ncbi:uncharacterized protein LOC123682617 [Harmonia axyridis]|uniref:uncharacterized protein LOC123682617 n=1 Tax=Harmonia axyridis TaxID=115357 RepID=UPI001E277445|nr:uncharacterized protein LOC123682617 [Harmonia axyridis]
MPCVPRHREKNWFFGVGVSVDGVVNCIANVYVRHEVKRPVPVGPLGITVIAPSLPADLFFPRWKLRVERYSEELLDTVVMQHRIGPETSETKQEVRFVFPSIAAKNLFYELVKYS